MEIHLHLKRLFRGTIASVRDYIVSQAVSNNNSIVITVEGIPGKMTLTPEMLKSKSFQMVKDDFNSKFNSAQDYKLIDFGWKPDKN